MTASESSHDGRLRVIVTGATGTIGASVIEALSARDEVGEIVGLARHQPAWRTQKTDWIRADVLSSELEPIFAGADAVIHLAWTIPPSHDLRTLERTNVDGSRRVFEAAAAADVEKLIYASSAGAYSPGPKGHPISEDWPLGGTETSLYSRHKAMMEAELDEFELRVPKTKVVRLRPALIFKGEAATEIRRLFAGPFLPGFLLRRGLVPAVPRVSGLCLQAVHSSDVGRAYALATVHDVRGPFNLAADPPLDSAELAATLSAGTFPLPFAVARRLADLSWRLRLQPTAPGWLDMAKNVPLISSERAMRELGWEPEETAIEAVAELLGAGPNGGKVARRARPLGKLIEQLGEVHALEKQALAQLRRAPKISGDDRIAEVFATHLRETEDQERRVRDRLEAHGADPSKLKDATGGVGVVAFASSQPDTPAKLAVHAFSYAHLEIAAYELLGRTAETAGDAATAAMAQEIVLEEERMAGRLSRCFDVVVETSLNGDGPAELGPQLDRYLVAAHAIEKQGLQLLEIAPKVIEDAGLKELFSKHLHESEEHELMLRERLEARGSDPAKAKDAALRISGLQLGAFFAAQPDTAARLSGFVFAFENLEIATYELLARAARRAGDEKVLGVTERILAEERAAAKELAGRWNRAASPASS
jgi:nucleoside-diphosphate-sugar epimerase/ferritin-like metal-binding protein YciE